MIAFLFHSLQYQIIAEYSDVKIVEMLCYVLQMFARLDELEGKTALPNQQPGIVDEFIFIYNHFNHDD